MKQSDKPQGITRTELLIWPKGHLRVLLIIGIPFFIFFIKEVGVTEGYRFAASPSPTCYYIYIQLRGCHSRSPM